VSADETVVAEAEIRRRAKAALRRQMRAVRDTLPESACATRSAEIGKRLLALKELDEAETIVAFASIRNEVRTRALMDAGWVAGKRIALPRVVDDELELRLVDSETALVPGAFSVPEPPDGAELVEPGEVDFALVPALAVDPRGYRIGYGGGYYDRLLPRLGRAWSCAVVYDFQLVSEVPRLPFDVPVDLVVTDQRVIRVE
jgi:5-formyltetrahydrofolate cyclo-ligase